ncbi:MAG: hypothetical protein A2900_02635 [Candidatus Chisholmbacteria bacterium RIFCSPLOWO2_01_FULL_50_28]|uniref:Glycosyltransferase 2-like domain-containing protein n=1 Tax=Candidatus Chisholmbacteria bacterium RIFCSPHIGHO2_01_FULL_52_32 TaxID=1797591 RepID=A0A1G1VTC4_9BACT|nr:MAG: hypothetical protein A2786_04110 [Candidatus Chisholmbacteria bacterium RIFCSPHIGHO2_01_FULL_52_32]OGY19975.1 MAG: hypothetical protein A2900_02635 [Candidatus Chisholmbacteria bacterium RIFCSPLOWO2_01_FULL_50_28]
MRNISVVIPIYNEEEILSATVEGLIRKLKTGHGKGIEVILVDNGSTDRTPEILSLLSEKFSWIKVVKYPYPDFGEAVRLGIRRASKPFVLLLNADWWEESFFNQAYEKRFEFDIIVGSKELESGLDKRPLIRKVGTHFLTVITKALFGYKGKDTHGLKLMNTRRVLPLIDKCTTHEILETELMVRAQKENLRICEIPCPVREIRKARVSFARRCIRNLVELALLYRQLQGAKLVLYSRRAWNGFISSLILDLHQPWWGLKYFLRSF